MMGKEDGRALVDKAKGLLKKMLLVMLKKKLEKKAEEENAGVEIDEAGNDGEFIFACDCLLTAMLTHQLYIIHHLQMLRRKRPPTTPTSLRSSLVVRLPSVLLPWPRPQRSKFMMLSRPSSARTCLMLPKSSRPSASA